MSSTRCSVAAPGLSMSVDKRPLLDHLLLFSSSRHLLTSPMPLPMQAGRLLICKNRGSAPRLKVEQMSSTLVTKPVTEGHTQGTTGGMPILSFFALAAPAGPDMSLHAGDQLYNKSRQDACCPQPPQSQVAPAMQQPHNVAEHLRCPCPRTRHQTSMSSLPGTSFSSHQ